MADKSFTGQTDGTGNTPGYDPGTFRLSLKVSASYDEDKQKIKLNYTAIVGHYNFTKGNNIVVVINGTTVCDKNPGKIQIDQGESFILASGTTYITPNSSGTTKITCYAKFTQSQYSCFNVSTNTNGSITVITSIDGWPLANVFLKLGDNWKNCTMYIMINGEWKTVTNTYLKLDEK